MKTEIEAAVKENARKSKSANNQDEAMKYAQAALNLVNALETLNNINHVTQIKGRGNER